MPFYQKITIDAATQIYFWEITEPLTYLQEITTLHTNSQLRLEKLKNKSHQVGFLAIRQLLQMAGLNDRDVFYDAEGKPHLVNGQHISMSHTAQFAMIGISQKPIGVDVEMINKKILLLAPRFMNKNHLEKVSEDDKMIKATVVWGIKEAVFKIINQKGISYKADIIEDEFCIANKFTKARAMVGERLLSFKVAFDIIENAVYVVAQQN